MSNGLHTVQHLGNIFVGDITAGYSAGQGGDIVFAGDPNGQGRASATFANIRGIKENSTYNNSLGALVFGTQTGSADFRALSSVTEKMRITSDGYVGIGTGDPNNMLEVYKAADPKIILSDANTFKIALTTDGTNGTIESLNSAYATHVTPISFDLNTAVVTTRELHVTNTVSTTTTLQMGNNSHRILSAPDDFAIVQTTSANKAFRLLGNVPADTLVLESNGRVGMGTGAPISKLHVAGGTSHFSTSDFDHDANLGGALEIQPSTNYIALKSFKNGDSAWGDIVFPYGSVGIGTSVPDAKLHISGSDASSSTNSLLVENSAGVDMLWVDNGKNVNARDNLYVHHGTVSSRKIEIMVGWCSGI